MSGSPSNLAIVVHQAASRLRRRAAIAACGQGALLGAVAGLAWAVTSAALAIDVPALAAASPADGSIAVLISRVAIPLGITLAFAAAFGLASWLRPTAELAGARAIDLSLTRTSTPSIPASGTDVITSGWLFNSSQTTTGNVRGFEQATIAEAERLAASVDVRRAISLRPNPSTIRQLSVAGGSVVAIVLVATLLPRQWFAADGPAPKQLATPNLQVDAARALAAAVANRSADLPPKPEAEPGTDPTTNAPPSAVQRQLAALDELQKEIASGAGSKPSGSANSDPKLAGKAGVSEPSTGNDKALPVTQRAAKALDELAKAVDEQAQTVAQAESLLREKLAETKSSGSDGSTQPNAASATTPEPAFVDAMRRGDYAGATAELDKLEQTWNAMSPEQRQQAAGKMSDMAEQLKAANDREGRSNPASPSAKQPQDQAPATPTVATPTDSTDSELAKAAARGDAQAIEKELVQQGRTPEDAARAADEAIRSEQAKQQQRAAAEQAKQKTKTLAERLKELSDELKARQAEKEKAGQDGTKPDPAKPEAAKPEQSKPEPTKPDQAKPDQGKPSASSPDPQGQIQPGEPRDTKKDGRQGQTGKPSSNSEKPSEGRSPGNTPGDKPDDKPGEKTSEPTATDGKPTDSGNRQAQQPDRSKPDATSGPELTSKPDSASKPGATSKPDPATKPDTTGKPDSAGNPDSSAKPAAGPNADAPARPDGTAKPDMNQPPALSQSLSAPKPDGTKPGTQAPSATPPQPDPTNPISTQPTPSGQPPAGTPEKKAPDSPGEPAPAQQPVAKPTASTRPEQTPRSTPQPGQPNQPDPNSQPGQPSPTGEKPAAKPAADQPGSPPPPPNQSPTGSSPAARPDAGKSGEHPPTGAKQPAPDGSPQPDQAAPTEPGQPKEPGQPGQPNQSAKPGPAAGAPANTKPSPTSDQQQNSTTKPSGSSPQQQPDAADKNQKPGSGFAKLREQLEQLQRDKNAPTQAAKDSAELREQARKILEGMSPAEREEMMKLARDMAAGNKDNSPSDRTPRDGTPEQRRRFGTADRIRPQSQTLSEFAAKPDGIIDARPTAGQMRTGGPQRTLAEWQGQGGKVAPADQGPLQESVRDAAGAAQQAIERQQVPKRMEDLVSRWYRRLPEAMGATKPTPASPPTSGEPK